MLRDIPQGGPVDPVILNTQGKPYTAVPTSFTKTVAALGLNTGRARLDRLSFHGFRHTAATNLAKRLDIRTLMDTRGWRVVAMAVRYVHADEQAKGSALSSLDQVMTQQKGNVVEFLKVAEIRTK